MTTKAPAPASPATGLPGRRFVIAHAAAPVLLGAYGLVRLLPGSREPGTGWTVGHLCLLGGLLAFGLVFRDLYRALADRGRATALLCYGAALTGVVAGAGQALIDLYGGFVNDTQAEQDRFFADVQSHPGVLPVFYQVLPVLFHLGLLTMVAILAFRRRLPFWSPLAVLAGLVVAAASLDLMTLGAALYALALLPLHRPARHRA